MVRGLFAALILANLLIASSLQEQTSVKRVILYDGVCNFCNKWVDTVLSLDRHKKFKFSALQSDAGRSLLQAIDKQPNDLSSVVYIRSLDPKEFYTKSDAAIKVAEDLGVPKPLTLILFNLFPKALRDNMYDVVANNRYSILGKREECRCGDSGSSDRFL